MIANGEMVANLINASASGIAALTAEALEKRRAGLVQRYGSAATRAWRDCVSSRLPYLVAAVNTACPRVFVEQARWAYTAYASRGGDAAAADFLVSLECLRDVVRSELPADAGRLAASYVDHAIDSLRIDPPTPVAPIDAGTRFGRLSSAYLAAVLCGDRRRALQIILDAANGADGLPAVPVRNLYLDVLLPAQFELGRMWHLNEATVAEEHLVTATTQLVLSQLYTMLPMGPRNGLTAVAASVEGNAHDVGVRVLADLLEADGWSVVYLGASVPGAELAQAVEMFRADLVAVSAGLGCQLPAVTQTIECLRSGGECGRNVRILLGGAGFAGTDDAQPAPLWRRLGADGYASSIDEGLRVAAQLCGARGTTGRD